MLLYFREKHFLCLLAGSWMSRRKPLPPINYLTHYGPFTPLWGSGQVTSSSYVTDTYIHYSLSQSHQGAIWSLRSYLNMDAFGLWEEIGVCMETGRTSKRPLIQLGTDPMTCLFRCGSANHSSHNIPVDMRQPFILAEPKNHQYFCDWHAVFPCLSRCGC